MKEAKRRIIKDVARKINDLPDDKQQYVLGIMDGIMISSGNTRREPAAGKVCGKEQE